MKPAETTGMPSGLGGIDLAGRAGRTCAVKTMKRPIIHNEEIMFHAGTGTIGQVVDTIYPPDKKREKYKQVLQLRDGTRRQFRLVELQPAVSFAIEQWCEKARMLREGEGLAE